MSHKEKKVTEEIDIKEDGQKIEVTVSDEQMNLDLTEESNGIGYEILNITGKGH
jgi:hypothetical protein